jgi:hypothetical protein
MASATPSQQRRSLSSNLTLPPNRFVFFVEFVFFYYDPRVDTRTKGTKRKQVERIVWGYPEPSRGFSSNLGFFKTIFVMSEKNEYRFSPVIGANPG